VLTSTLSTLAQECPALKLLRLTDAPLIEATDLEAISQQQPQVVVECHTTAQAVSEQADQGVQGPTLPDSSQQPAAGEQMSDGSPLMLQPGIVLEAAVCAALPAATHALPLPLADCTNRGRFDPAPSSAVALAKVQRREVAPAAAGNVECVGSSADGGGGTWGNLLSFLSHQAQ
jgi:hypothetical protein